MTLAARARRKAAAGAEALFDPGGQLAQMLGALPAVTDKALGNGHAAAEPRYRELLEALGVAVYTTDREGRITFFNDAAALFWGRRPELGEEWCGSWRLYWPDGTPLPHGDCPMAIALRENRPVRGYEAIAERPDGSRVSFVPYPTPLRDADGKLVGGVNVLIDVTERRQAEETLRGTAEALRTSNAVKDEFLGLVSHELRTPVTTIYGNAQLLIDRADQLSEEQKRSMVADIADDSGRLLGIIENMLLLTRLEPGAKPSLEPQVLTHVVRKAIESFQRRKFARPVALIADKRQIVVEADRTYIELLMENLLSNADKYSPEGQPIEVVLQIRDGEVQVRVLDRGIGMEDAEADRLFTPFYRTSAGKKFANGIGIGLAVCKRVVETQGGRIWARAREAGGSELGFALPLTEELLN
jgi:PAS domain S-box-containing protein